MLGWRCATDKEWWPFFTPQQQRSTGYRSCSRLVVRHVVRTRGTFPEVEERRVGRVLPRTPPRRGERRIPSWTRGPVSRRVGQPFSEADTPRLQRLVSDYRLRVQIGSCRLQKSGSRGVMSAKDSRVVAHLRRLAHTVRRAQAPNSPSAWSVFSRRSLGDRERLHLDSVHIPILDQYRLASSKNLRTEQCFV